MESRLPVVAGTTPSRFGTRSLEIASRRSVVDTDAGDLFSIGTPRHRKDPEIVRSQDTD